MSDTDFLDAKNMTKFTKEWFEMTDLRRRRFVNAVWVPLRSSVTNKHCEVGEEVFASACVAFPPNKRAEAEELGWSSIGLMHDGGPYAFRDGRYKPSEVYQFNDGEDMGVDMILPQRFCGGHPEIWHLNQDLVLALGLMKEGDVWVRPEEDYIEVIREHKNENGRVISIEIRGEFLRDYLAARGLALRLVYYRQRIATLPDVSHIDWPTPGIREEKPHDRFCTNIFEVDAEGAPFGGGVAVFHLWRTDVDPDEDVPVFGPENDSNTDGHSATYSRGGPKAFRVEGELWREEWIEPAERSERVRGDDPADFVTFVIDASGRRVKSQELDDQDIGRYLWFRPDVIPALAGRRGGDLQWYTRDTGSVRCSPDYRTHFGLNRLGLVNVYAYDVAKLPPWQQRIWAGYNVSPDGAVSSELLASQMRAQPAATKAPETEFQRELNLLDEAVREWLGTPLFLPHEMSQEVLRSVHRFRGLKTGGLLELAKDVARLTADRINIGALRKAVAPPKGENWGSLKSLEKAVATIISPERARAMLSPLVGIYELRLGDAHLSSSKIENGLMMIGINVETTPIDQGQQLIANTVNALVKLRVAIDQRQRCD